MRQKLIPHIWFEQDARKIADWYVEVFGNGQVDGHVTLHNTPSGDADIVTVTLYDQQFQFLGGGRLAERNPSFSYMVALPDVKTVDALWDRLSEGGEILMPLEEYPFSKRFGFLKDQHGVSWQLMLDGGMEIQTIAPSLMFTREVSGRAEEAVDYYRSLLGGEVMENHISYYGPGQEPEVEGTLGYARVKLAGREIVLSDSADAHEFDFNLMQSLILYCKDQKEIDRAWAHLSADPESEQCGWLKDRFGVSWQVTPFELEQMMEEATPEQMERLTEAIMPMKKIDLAVLRDAYSGE
ncbi:VOC family protein [Jeotgalibacillus proteolyticus]|uniref:VOC family protein n=1 Tax=Jeotgalibacillus proteolyticus TaxID=2082395 RepID=A0A2S5GDH8_9BACL|nr:VOC family protein [Jeotgalibacillus proteolyticus]PPA71060.1 VOC family protein [Jeotgalibacillus proteolyticus]